MKVILVMAMTLDGKIARHATDPVDWTGSADKRYFVQITRSAGVMIMGNNTFNAIGRPLPGRHNVVMTRTLEGKQNAKNLQFTDKPPAEIIQALAMAGYKEATLIGGAQVNTLFASQKLIHEIHLTLAPRLFGQGLALFSRELDLRLNLLDVKALETDVVLLKYKVCR